MYYTYILSCKDTTYYIGYTSDINRRMSEHSKGEGCKYTRARGFDKLEIYWATRERKDAMKLEYYLKTLTRSQKTDIIQNPHLLGIKYGLDLSVKYILGEQS
jgi:putative endonuclease